MNSTMDQKSFEKVTIKNFVKTITIPETPNTLSIGQRLTYHTPPATPYEEAMQNMDLNAFKKLLQ